MKKDIHPKYHAATKVTCACGATYTMGGTRERMEVEVCGACHPLYTGKGMGAGRGSRVDRFRKRAEKHAEIKTVRAAKTPATSAKKAAGKKVLKGFQ